ncbi:MAG TPA: DUF4350 domain-containing protein [Bacteroidetes bacterium]|nr:DUF4350 domain-containing protein [Bacteroidota bacterium]
MTKEVKIYIGILILVVAGIIFSNTNTKSKVNWFESYVKDHKIPYGTYILYNELSNLFPESKIQTVNISPYDFLEEKFPKKNNLYILINKRIDIGNEEFEKMKEFVKEGNDILISSHSFLLDSFGFKTKYFTFPNFNDSISFNLSNSIFKDKKYYFDRDFTPDVFEKIDTPHTTVAGIFSYENKEGEVIKTGINFVKYDFGEGSIYLHTMPEVFTNYNLIHSPNENYTSGLLSYFGKPTMIFWDSYYKNGRSKIQSPLHYIFNNQSLKWAYYFLLISILVFIIFEGKRKQKPIPVIYPEKSRTLEFTRTIANMYYEKSNHKKIALMKINYFFDYIRTHFLLETNNINEDFLKKLSSKSAIRHQKIEKLFVFIDNLKKKPVVTKEELTDLEKLINEIKL